MTTAFLLGDIKRDEGCKLVAYPDPLTNAAPWTIGYGHTGREVHPGLKIIQAQADAWCVADLAAAVRGLDTALPWWRQLSDVRQDVLANMAFQMGVHGVLEFTHAIDALKRGAVVVAGQELLNSAWARSQTPKRAKRLADQLQSGVRAPQPGDPKMTDTTTTATAPVAKSPLASTTIQGAMITMAGALAPTFATMLHVPTQDLVNVAGAVATIIGFAMTIIGRMKATKPIA